MTICGSEVEKGMLFPKIIWLCEDVPRVFLALSS